MLAKKDKGADISDDDSTTADLYETPIEQTPQLLSGFHNLTNFADRHARLHELWTTAVRRRMNWCGFDVTYMRAELNMPYNKGPRFSKMWLNGGEKKKKIKWWTQCFEGGFVSLTRDDATGVWSLPDMLGDFSLRALQQ